ncbi:Serine carboxypeptidase S10 family member 1-like [Oopsacas minuta]|uniref:Carboxypeptidase n=1 Tax=Oopsacas minuta TaxID=111878 RepID=A0AAV7KDK0_9METZ|nr:Serine carboxypeptidase S10 family member 1-like [Oopsacas minuta]
MPLIQFHFFAFLIILAVTAVKHIYTLPEIPVEGLPRNFSWPDKVKQFSGYINVNKTHGNHFFYWFFESRSKPSEDPLILWLTGGPGCASTLALLVENGPFLIDNDNGKLNYNPYGWNSFANLLYVDQPVGTGFSYTDNPLGFETNEQTIARELTTFMEEFYQNYPKYSKLPFYIIGESYAGHYIPPFSAYILKNSQIVKANLKGIAIGDGWVNPKLQFSSYLDYMSSIDYISQSNYEMIDEVFRKPCMKLFELGSYYLSGIECEIYSSALMDAAELHMKRSINTYDVRVRCIEPPMCYNFSSTHKFLNRKDVQMALGVDRYWLSCNLIPDIVLLLDENKDYHADVAFTLSQGVRVLVYSGKDDYICNYLGGKAWTESMEWSGKSEFSEKNLTNWIYNGAKVGEFKAVKDLTLLFIEKSGHMVPMNQPEVSLAMVNHFLNGKPFQSD